MRDVVYFSSVSENTARFVSKLAELYPFDLHRIPLRRTEPELHMDREFVLVTPTYAAGYDPNIETIPDAVPKQVIRFLNDPSNRELLRGVVSCGNTNFGRAFCIAGDIIARKTGVPHLAKVELFGTPEDVHAVSSLIRGL